MNFFENKDTLQLHLNEALHVNKERIKKVVTLCDYLDSDFYDAQDEEEIQVVSHIEKQLEIICTKMLKVLSDSFTCKDLNFGYCLPAFYKRHEGIFYLWGMMSDEEKLLETPTFKKHPTFVNNQERFIATVDIRKGIEIIPWNQ